MMIKNPLKNSIIQYFSLSEKDAELWVARLLDDPVLIASQNADRIFDALIFLLGRQAQNRGLEHLPIKNKEGLLCGIRLAQNAQAQSRLVPLDEKHMKQDKNEMTVSLATGSKQLKLDIREYASSIRAHKIEDQPWFYILNEICPYNDYDTSGYKSDKQNLSLQEGLFSKSDISKPLGQITETTSSKKLGKEFFYPMDPDTDIMPVKSDTSYEDELSPTMKGAW